MIKRRLLAVGLVATMMVSICGCGAKDSKKDETKCGETSIVEEVTTEDTEEEVSTGATEKTEETASTDNTEADEQETTLNQDTSEESTTEEKKTEEQTTKKPTTTTQSITSKNEQSTTKPSKDPNNSSNVNEKLKWTNAGWASELKHTSSGDYVYVTNKKQTIDAVKGNAFSMTSKNFSLIEWDVMSLDSYIKGNPGTIRWTSADPSIAQVINNELVGIYAGTTKISGTCGNTTVQITVTVERGWKSCDVTLNSNLVNLYPGESFQLIASERNVKYTSSDSNM